MLFKRFDKLVCCIGIMFLVALIMHLKFYSLERTLNHERIIKNENMSFKYYKDGDLFLYSAFLDVREKSKHVIRIIAVSPWITKKIYCRLYYHHGNKLTVSADISRLSEYKGFKYAGHLYSCVVPSAKDPFKVSVIKTFNSETESSKLQLIKVGNKLDKDFLKPSFATCLNQLHKYSHVHKLIQYVEYQRHVVGINKIIIYDFDGVSNEVMKAVRYYEEIGLVSVQPFKLPVKTACFPSQGGEIKCWGQVVQINDCLYRNMDKYKYLVTTDVDEYVMVHQENLETYSDIVEAVNTEEPKEKPLASYRLKSAFFCVSEDDDKRKSNAFLMKNTKRKRFEKYRFKCIVNPRGVITNNIHVVSKAMEGYNTFTNVPEDIAFVHHYRSIETTCNITDTAAIKYSHVLLNHVNKVCSDLNLEFLEPY